MLRRIKWSRASRVVSALAVLSGGALAGVLAGTSEASAAGAGHITSVTFTGGYANPTVTIKGADFGKEPTPGVTSPCGYSGVDFLGNKAFDFLDNTRIWSAGNDDGGDGACIGVNISSWTAKNIVFTFGNAYNNADAGGVWVIHSGDRYTVKVKTGVFRAVAP